MAFFQNRLSRPLPPVYFPADDAPQLYPRPKKKSSLSRASPSRLIRRVSSIFSTSKKRPFHAPIGNIAVHRRNSSQSPSPSTLSAEDEDIRRPSGLGPRAGSFVSNHSLPPHAAESPRVFKFDLGPRSRSLSSPNMLHSDVRGILQARSTLAPSIKPLVAIDVPAEVLEAIFTFLPRCTVAAFALVSRLFYRATRSVLYRTIDLRALGPKRVEQLRALLAHRQDLADVVRTFICDDWPPAVYSPIRFPSLSPSFSITLQSMHNLTALTIPSFDSTIIRGQLPFRLTRLTLLNTALSLDEQTSLFEWLDGQPEITYLAFPNLVEGPQDIPNADTGAMSLLKRTSIPRLVPPTKTGPTSPTPFDSPFLLPLLSSLQAPPTLAALLAPVRSLTEVTVHIQTTLYAGLRPCALMAAFRGVKCLSVRFGENIDRRSVEKVLGAAGAVLGKFQHGSEPLEVLEVEVRWSGEEELYKIITCVLPRFRALRVLRLHSHPINAVSDRVGIVFPALGPSDSDLDLPGNGSFSDEHRAYVKSWVKHCPNLRVVKFLSGQEWHGQVTET